MTARIKISQAGLASGVAGVSRTDGLATGALVTLEDVSGSGLSTFHLLWGPPEDATAEASLGVTGDPDVWTFTPAALSYGSYLIELRDDGVPVERRVFGVRTPSNHLLIPALNERASRHSGWDNDGPAQAELSENNAVDFPDATLNAFAYAGWWRALRELYQVVEFGTGSIADHAIALVKLALAPAKAVIANATNAAGNAAYVAGSAALQYLRVNAANTGLEWATLSAHASTSLVYDAASNSFQRAPLTGAVTAGQDSNATAFGALAAKSVLANATNVSGVPAAVAGSATFQYLRVNSANTGLEWATVSVHASTSLIYDGATNTWQRAALTGAVTSSQNSNATAFGVLAAKSVLANATNGSAVPAALAGTTARQYLRVTGAQTALEMGKLADGVQTTAASVTANTTVLPTTGSYSIPAATLVVGSRFKCEFTFQFIRGATATALNLGCFFNIGTGAISLAPASQTAAAIYQMRVVAEFTVTSTGAGGAAMATISAIGDGITASQAHSANVGLAIDTTIANAIQGAAQMSVTVAGTSITCTGGHLMQLN